MTLSRLNCEPLLEFQSQSVSIFFNNKKKKSEGNRFLRFRKFVSSILFLSRGDKSSRPARWERGDAACVFACVKWFFPAR